MDLIGDGVGGLGSLRGKLLHLGSDHRKAPARLACARRFYRSVQCQKVGLVGNSPDNRDNRAYLLSSTGKAGDIAIGPVSLMCRRLDDSVCPMRLIGNLSYRAAQLLRCRRHGVRVIGSTSRYVRGVRRLEGCYFCGLRQRPG